MRKFVLQIAPRSGKLLGKELCKSSSIILRRSYAVFQSDFFICLFPDLSAALFPLPQFKGKERRTAHRKSAVLCVGRAGLPAADGRCRGCELGLWPSARQAAGAKVSGARGDLQSALPRRVQVHGLFAGKRLCASTHRARRAADRPAHWHLVLHVPGHELCD